MAPISNENEVLTAPPQKAAATSSGVGTETSNRPLPVALEVPVTVNGARTVDGSDKREPFSEATKTVLVFGNGAVIRLGSPVTAGQLLFLTNEKTKKEVVCQVVKSKNYRNVSGYVELEFTESVVGFWGMRFPTDRIGGQAPAPVQAAAVPSATKVAPLAPVSATSKLASPVISAAPPLTGIKTVPIQAEVKPAPHPRPVEVKTVAPAAPVTAPPIAQTPSTPVLPTVKKPEVPVSPAQAISPSLASTVASLFSAPESVPGLLPSKPPVSPIAVESKKEPVNGAGNASTEDLKLQAARLQEQLSSLLFSAAPTAKPAAPVVPPLDAKTVSNVVASVLEIAKEPVPVVSSPVAKTPAPPIKSSLDTEGVKIPSWLEPLARNAASPTQELSEREKAKQAAEIAAPEEHRAEMAADAVEEGAPEIRMPTFGSLLPMDEEVSTQDRPSGGSRKVVWIGAIAAAVLLAAGGAWYALHPTSSAHGAAQPVVTAAIPQAIVPSPVAPTTQTAPQNPASTQQGTSGASTTTPTFNSPPASTTLAKPQVEQKPAQVTRDNTRGSGATIPASVTERIERPAADSEPKKPVLGEVHLASPTLNRPAKGQDDGIAAPTISTGNTDANAAGLDSGLGMGGSKQPAVPEVPLPTGGDVKSAKLISSVAPQYPALAKNQHVAGNVIIDALIDPNGRVSAMKVISGPTLLHQAAMDALKQWKYQPASLDGKAVAMHLTVTVQFRLQ
jgi:protein TonB